MALFFADVEAPSDLIVLDDNTSRHINQVLRMKNGDALQLTNGRGKKITASIVAQDRKSCTVSVKAVESIEKRRPVIGIAISLVKNTSRLEWFLEKATEIGVNTIIPLLCERTEKSHFRADRMKSILISAMLQSQQYWLPELQEPVVFKNWVTKSGAANKWIAHCVDSEKHQLKAGTDDNIICIGPEGDFTSAEIALALENGFQPVTLGATRLRTETAGMVAATLLRIAY